MISSSLLRFSKKTFCVFAILRFADTAAILILPPGHPIMIIEINIFLCEQLISMFIMGCPGGKINMAAVSAKRSILLRPQTSAKK